jgi:hypothetical protein
MQTSIGWCKIHRFVEQYARIQTGSRNKMQNSINKPIFVVGSPRSGTSILTWCLGRHPNIFPVPESNWLGDFAVNIEMCYRIGAARGNRSLLSAMDVQRDEFFAHFGRSINNLILKHRVDLDRKRMVEGVQRRLKDRGFYACDVSGELNAATIDAIRQFQISNHSEASGELNMETLREIELKGSESTLKTRWVDGTPEYSLHIYALRNLFPDAVFVHIVRDVSAVVRSMLNFHRLAGFQLVANEEEAYRYWFRTVSACVKAEEAYGPRVVYRLPYADLIENPESALQSLLNFLGEPYTVACLEPLARRINTSSVPPDFVIDNSAVDPAVVDQAMNLWRCLENTPQPIEPSPAEASLLERTFQERVEYIRDLQSGYRNLERPLNE